MKTKNPYWLRCCYHERGAVDLGAFHSPADANDAAHEMLESNPEIRFVYVMHTDAFGEYFRLTVRRGPEVPHGTQF